MENNFYVYVYLDQRKPGVWSYGDKKFEYQPFYIGKGKRNRMNQHLQPKSRSDNSIKSNIINAVEKELGELPIHYKLFENLSFEQSNEIETSLIQHFGRIDINTGILANMTDGGEGFKNMTITESARNKMSEVKINMFIGKKSPSSKKVIQYSLKGEFIKEWDSLSDITRETGICFKGISACCRSKCKTFKGYVWKYNGTAYIPIIKAEVIERRKKVYQYTLDGKFIKEWESVSKAAMDLKVNHISGACLGQFKCAGGFQWSFVFLGNKIESVKYDNTKISANKNRTIGCFKDGVLHKEFKKIAEARKWLGLKTNANISACCNGRAKSAYGYVWKFL